MTNIPKFWGLHALPKKNLAIALSCLPFILLALLYFTGSSIRQKENPQDKILPTLSTMVDSISNLAFKEDPRSGEYILLNDTKSSLFRLGVGMLVASITGFLLGINMGLFPGMSHLLSGFVTFVSIIPPLSILPILFITFGVDEMGKIMLIILGTVPIIARDIYLTTKKIPVEQITKSLTLGASELTLVYRIIVPQVFPKLLETVRLTMGAAWLFLIAAEAIASESGLGYRIFLVRRYLSMDVIIPYVLWITLLGFSFDFFLRWIVANKFRWYTAGKD
jgi:NitT/TauT family transport system permease protein